MKRCWINNKIDDHCTKHGLGLCILYNPNAFFTFGTSTFNCYKCSNRSKGSGGYMFWFWVLLPSHAFQLTIWNGLIISETSHSLNSPEQSTQTMRTGAETGLSGPCGQHFLIQTAPAVSTVWLSGETMSSAGVCDLCLQQRPRAWSLEGELFVQLISCPALSPFLPPTNFSLILIVHGK